MLNDPFNNRSEPVLTFLPSGMVERSTSTFAIANTSAEADMFTRKSTNTESQLAIPIDPKSTIPISMKLSSSTQLPFPPPSPSMPTQHTLNSSLSPSSRQSSHSPHHEVLKQQIAIHTCLRPVMAEIRDLVGILVAGAAERALERTCRVDIGRCSNAVLRGRCAEAADAGEMCP
jgi:hypothetical protein